MPKIKFYDVESSKVSKHNDPGMVHFFEQGIKTHTQTTSEDKLSESEKILKKALHNDHCSVYLVGPSDEVTTNKRNETVQHMMLVVNDYSKAEPTSQFLKLELYTSSGGVSQGYYIRSNPKDYETFQPDLQEKYAAIVDYETELAYAETASSTDEDYLAHSDDSEDEGSMSYR